MENHLTAQDVGTGPAREGRRKPPSLGGWPGLILGLALLLLFIFVIVPFWNDLPGVKPLADYIEESGIDAGALYYTEVEETGEAETHMRTTFEYTPRAQ